MSEPSSDPGAILRATSEQYGNQLKGLEQQVTVHEDAIKNLKKGVADVTEAKKQIDATIEKLPKPKIPIAQGT
jgi:hypothetical protein